MSETFETLKTFLTKKMFMNHYVVALFVIPLQILKKTLRWILIRKIIITIPESWYKCLAMATVVIVA